MSELSELTARRDEVQAQLRSIEEESAGGVERILEAIKSQRRKIIVIMQIIRL